MIGRTKLKGHKRIVVKVDSAGSNLGTGGMATKPKRHRI